MRSLHVVTVEPWIDEQGRGWPTGCLLWISEHVYRRWAPLGYFARRLVLSSFRGRPYWRDATCPEWRRIQENTPAKPPAGKVQKKPPIPLDKPPVRQYQGCGGCHKAKKQNGVPV